MEAVWTKESIHDLLDRSAKAVEKALLVLFNRQTDTEQAAEDTKFLNRKGFTAADAPRLTNIAKALIRYKNLTPKQVVLVRRRIKKYWKQLLQEAETNGRRVRY